MGTKKGTIKVESGAQVSAYEYAAAEYFRTAGNTVVFLTPSRIPHRRTADILLDGQPWEIKTPFGNGSRTIQDILRSGKRQSDSIVLDLRFTKRTEQQALTEATLFFARSRSLRRLCIITKSRTPIWLED